MPPATPFDSLLAPRSGGIDLRHRARAPARPDTRARFGQVRESGDGARDVSVKFADRVRKVSERVSVPLSKRDRGLLASVLIEPRDPSRAVDRIVPVLPKSPRDPGCGLLGANAPQVDCIEHLPASDLTWGPHPGTSRAAVLPCGHPFSIKAHAWLFVGVRGRVGRAGVQRPFTLHGRPDPGHGHRHGRWHGVVRLRRSSDRHGHRWFGDISRSS